MALGAVPRGRVGFPGGAAPGSGWRSSRPPGRRARPAWHERGMHETSENCESYTFAVPRECGRKKVRRWLPAPAAASARLRARCAAASRPFSDDTGQARIAVQADSALRSAGARAGAAERDRGSRPPPRLVEPAPGLLGATTRPTWVVVRPSAWIWRRAARVGSHVLRGAPAVPLIRLRNPHARLVCDVAAGAPERARVLPEMWPGSRPAMPGRTSPSCAPTKARRGR
jgi:hypothetical protein